MPGGRGESVLSLMRWVTSITQHQETRYAWDAPNTDATQQCPERMQPENLREINDGWLMFIEQEPGVLWDANTPGILQEQGGMQIDLHRMCSTVWKQVLACSYPLRRDITKRDASVLTIGVM